VAKTAAMLEPLRYLAAIEWLSAAQAADLRPVAVASMGRGARAAYEILRAAVPMLVEDRPLGPDIETAAALLPR
jgi:histidine ammonia-lyase